ncbi:MAG: hypothetical protein ACR2G3_04955 [Solirubrobacterales bacterium]
MRMRAIGSIAAVGALAFAGCGGDDEGDIQVFCDKVEEIQSAEDPFAGIQGDDIGAATAALEEAQGLFQEVADVAPEEIRGDVEEAQTFFDDFVEAAQDAKSPEDFLAIATEFQQEAEDFEATSQRLEEYTNENCGESESPEEG